MNTKRKLFSLLLALALLAAPALTAPARAALPDGFWPYLDAWQQALAGGNEDEIVAKGDAYLAFLSRHELTQEIAENRYNVYLSYLDREIFENRSDFDRAAENTEALQKISEYLQSIGADRQDMITRCRTHLGKLRPAAEVYAASYAQSSRYGSKIAPASGAYYGSIADGSYGDRSICSFYVECESETAKQFDYLIDPKADGRRVILINLNFKGEGATAAAVPSGTYDAKLRETLGYLNTLKSPVLLRIGGEMDNWSNPSVTPAVYIKAYRHIASMARSLAPKVELVWSPNCVAGWGKDAADYYPGDDVADWIGLSLYYNYDANGGDESITWVEFTNAKQFADPITVAEKVFTFAKEHNKPAIATEGGLTRSNGEAYAARQVAKEFSTLTMVYPQVKAIVYFDRSYNGEDFRLTGAVRTAADAAVAANPSLIPHGSDSAATWAPLSAFNEAPKDGAVLLGATGHTYHNVDMSAVYTLDGRQLAAADGSPNLCRIPVSTLSGGSHALEVRLSDGHGYTVTRSYTLSVSAGKLSALEAAAAPAEPDRGGTEPDKSGAAPADTQAGGAAGDYYSTDIVTTVNGSVIESINIGGRTLVSAEALDGHGFKVVWNGTARTLDLTRAEATAAPAAPGGSAPAKPGVKIGSYYNTDIVTSLDGRRIDAWNTGGRTWICAEDMGGYGYSVVWDAADRTLTVTGR